MTALRGPLDPWDRPPDPRDPMTLTGDLLADANRWCLENLPGPGDLVWTEASYMADPVGPCDDEAIPTGTPRP